MKKLYLLIVVFMALFINGCTNKSDAERALTAEGYKNIKITGYNFLSCSKDDFYRTGFKATNRDGKIINGTVCSGLFF